MPTHTCKHTQRHTHRLCGKRSQMQQRSLQCANVKPKSSQSLRTLLCKKRASLWELRNAHRQANKQTHNIHTHTYMYIQCTCVCTFAFVIVLALLSSKPLSFQSPSLQHSLSLPLPHTHIHSALSLSLSLHVAVRVCRTLLISHKAETEEQSSSSS